MFILGPLHFWRFPIPGWKPIDAGKVLPLLEDHAVEENIG